MLLLECRALVWTLRRAEGTPNGSPPLAGTPRFAERALQERRLDLCRVLRGAPRLRGVRLILISGSWTNERQEEAKRIGVDGCLQKPVNPDQLANMVKRLLA